MHHTGPQLEMLTRRLAETPNEFLSAPKKESIEPAFVPALIHDLLLRYGPQVQPDLVTRYNRTEILADRNRIALTMISIWLLSDDWFLHAEIPQTSIYRLIDKTVPELAAIMAAPKFVTDPDRREELVRVFLAQLQYRPAGETPTQATDRLSSLSSLEQHRLLKQSRAAETRARAIRKALAEKAAQESADKWTRE